MRGADTDPWFITLEVNLGNGMMDLGSRTSPVGQKVRDAFHGGTLVFDQKMWCVLDLKVEYNNCIKFNPLHL